MSNTTTAFGRSINALRATVAGAAMAMTLAAVQPAEATNNGVSEKRVRAIVKQEVSKIQRVRGPAGPRGDAGPSGPSGPKRDPGPAGMDGFPSLFAHVKDDGAVNTDRSVGITQKNVFRDDIQVIDDRGRTLVSATYCFSGLPPVVGGQVTLDGHPGFSGLLRNL